ncbi:DNA-directed RNA polymerase subunit omega [Fluviispira multicolorata]|uniref:DNA-directed RNA polymerase subunit omega n=1 Tax=Fluviispira multicolorata TaxID=2654512 RepID=A0A833N5W4_9BACT|nr:DNA-directed RNA polymerase subunit omega [Fluviispira multicolorata]KAB8028610.1 DNA-directed RNA polymerase subunit omega [Fluviispira multicolorata]
MARISVQDCLDQIPNRFVVVMLAARRMRQLQKGSDALVECKNKEAVTALREIAAGKVGIKNAEIVPGLRLPNRIK